MSGFDQAGFGSMRISEGSSFVTEQLAFEQCFGQTGAVYWHKWFCSTLAGGVQRLRHQVLAGAGLAEQHHGGIGWGDPHHQGQHLAKGWTTPDQTLCLWLQVSMLHGLHFLDVARHLSTGIQQGSQLDIDVALPARGVVQVQYALALA